MATKKVVLLVLHSELESAYPPLNIALGAISSGANVILAFSHEGVDILLPNYIPIPSVGSIDIANGLSDFGAPSIEELITIASESGVRLIIVDNMILTNWNVERKELRWVLNEAADADLFLHF
ncbi:peroxiredoxin family protein [Alicyclobacillus sp. TC]|uniref:DsrE family protein n=1 Tax=Alicyclobacillus sp. TC TaxID=2606450 RepID=UPI001933655E|nr:DsrE family protein [Alicyclobacillus sp. TC]QRF24313.1 peroxiredoxin family protein [Alicyclobacillus sp. TC]